MEDKIKEILKIAVYAPSGDNSQPWAFKVLEDLVKIYCLPEKDNPVLNYQDSASLIAVGALIENILITATDFGLRAVLNYKNDDTKQVAEIVFSEDLNIIKDELSQFITKRHTNRYFYKDEKLESESRKYLLKEEGIPGVQLLIEEDKQKRLTLAEAGANAEIVNLENKVLHVNLFKTITWNEKQEKRNKHGLYINSMGFNPIQKFMFRLASNWNRMQLAIKLGLPKFIAREDTKLYASGCGMGLVCASGTDRIDYLSSGRFFQRKWLKLTKLGISAQPVTATLYLKKVMENNDKYSKEHIELMNKSFSNIEKIFNIQGEIPMMMFRFGKTSGEDTSTSRFDLDETIL